MCMLSTNTHTGKMSSSQGTYPALTSSTTPVTAPNSASQRGTKPSRAAIVVVEIVNTAAMRIAYTCSSVNVTRRPNDHVSDGGTAADSSDSSNPPATAPPVNSIAIISSPLPRNTVAKNRSSPAPIRSRITPMNHRNASPANGSRFNASTTASRRLPSSNQSPAVSVSFGSAQRNSTNVVVKNTANTIPATAAARGVRIAARVTTAAG